MTHRGEPGHDAAGMQGRAAHEGPGPQGRGRARAAGPTRPVGRPAAGAPGGAREAILAAARREFAERGFRTATLRSIAGRAGVDPALISHYFANKDGLFAATLDLPEGAADVLADALNHPAAERGPALAHGYLALWESPRTGPQLEALVRSALSSDLAMERIRGLIVDVATAHGVSAAPGAGSGAAGGPGPHGGGQGPTAPAGDGREAGADVSASRLGIVMTQLLGAAVGRYIVKVPFVAALPFEEFAAQCGRAAGAVLAQD